MEKVNNVSNAEGKKKKKKKRSKIGQMVIVTTISFILIIGPSILAGDDKVADGRTEAPVFSVRIQAAQRQTLNASLDVNGDIISTVQADVFPEVAGILVSVRVNLGDYVRRNDIIAEVDPSRPGMTYLNSPVRAPIAGIVSRTPLSTGSTVSLNSGITTISLNENLEISARIPEREVADLEVGLKAEVMLQAYPGEVFHATVNRVSPIVDSISRTKLINLSLDEQDPRVNAGMFARLKLNTRTYEDVLTVPSEAVLDDRGTSIVYVARDNAGVLTAQRREVSTGVSLQGWTVIQSGLAENESVVVQGQRLLSGGELLRIIGSVR